MRARPVRIGCSIQPQHADWADLRRAVLQAEELGADVVTVWDHFFPLYGDGDSWRDGKHFECWTMLAALAEATSRAELAPLVTPIGYRNPDLLADMARTVDHISGGRLILGLGGGWSRRDHDEYGYDFGTAGSRLDDLEAALHRIEARWRRLNPPPVHDLPVLIGGGGERRTLRIAARHADIWHCNANVDALRRKTRILDEWCAVEGRDPTAIERATSAGVVASDGRTSIEVPPEERAPAALAAGFTLFNVRVSGPHLDLGLLREWLAWRDQVNAAR
jgi:probable F420-dependent oxidoreductase